MCDDEMTEQNDAPSAISELQSAFPTILALEREKPALKPPKIWDPWSRTFVYDLEAYERELLRQNYPRWTGHFAILDFPRELRDNIYFQYLYRSKPLIWRRRSNYSRTHYCRGGEQNTFYLTHLHQEAINLFLVSRQVYEEALAVFYSANAFFLERGRKKALEGSLRLFPTKAGSMVHHIQVRYHDQYWQQSFSWDGSRPITIWPQIVRDARMAKEHFPRLVTFTALWQLDWHSLAQDELMKGLREATKNDVAQMFLRYLKRESVAGGVVPPRWLRVGLGPDPGTWYGWPCNNEHEPAVNKALNMLTQEMRDEPKDPILDGEEAGRKWLEEEWEDRKRAKKGKARRAG